MNRLLPYLLILISSAAMAESGAYRVEVIVLRNMNVEAESTVLHELRSFSRYPDAMETGQIGTSDKPLPVGISSDMPEFTGATSRGDLPDDLHILPDRSDFMNDIWRRLQSSQAYQPLVYTAWEQNRIDYYPPMRIHDENIIDTQFRSPTHSMIADLAEEDPLAAYRSTFYQLDGSLQLRRSRFLHLFLDLEYRENALAEESVLPVGNEMMYQPATGTMMIGDPMYRVFTLKQNRQVRTGEVQYFDTPYFGVLVLVSAITAD